VSEDEIKALAKEIAYQLGEVGATPRYQIKQILKNLGMDVVQGLLQKTLEIEADGGMMLPDNSRRRTIGGVFLYLARHTLTPEQKSLIFPHLRNKKKNSESSTQEAPTPQEPLLPPFVWEERIELIKGLLGEQGAAGTVKVTLIGRPGKIEMRKDLVVTTMKHTAKTSTYPKGVPSAPEDPTLYTVYLAAKQWRKVEESIANEPEDVLIIEGTCAFDPAIGGMAVYGQSVTTKEIEAKKRQAQKEAAALEKGEEPPPPPAPKPAPPKAQKPAEAAPPKAPSRVFAPSSSNVPPEVTQKLNELYASAALFRQKINAIQIKPEGQQFGLEMTQKLLKNVEDEIASLESKYAK